MAAVGRQPFFFLVSILSFSILLVVTTFQKFIDVNMTHSQDHDHRLRSVEVRNHTRQKEESYCLSFGSDFKKHLDSSKQIIIAMPAKASGTSMISFTTACTGKYLPGATFDREPLLNELLTYTYETPKIIANHFQDPKRKGMLRLVRSTSDDTLVIILHRHETDRLVSSIREVLARYCQYFYEDKLEHGMDRYVHGFSGEKDDNKKCVIDEKVLIDIIKDQVIEISISTNTIFGCDEFDAIEENKPNLLVVDYKKGNDLQMAIATKHCPDLIHQLPIHHNDGNDDRHNSIFVKLISGERENVPVNEWLTHKKEILEWTLDLHKESSCRGKVREMEKVLGQCEDESIVLSSIS